MGGVQTRKQAKETEQKLITPENAGINGSAKVSMARLDEPTENIFLFWPNIIGKALNLSKPNHILTLSRILAHSARPRVTVLHAPSPANMLDTLQHLLYS